MKHHRNYEENEVVKQLNKKQDCRVVGRHIELLTKGIGDIGIRTKGKIDFLVNFCGYTKYHVAKF